jgi:hypothetical protein
VGLDNALTPGSRKTESGTSSLDASPKRRMTLEHERALVFASLSLPRRSMQANSGNLVVERLPSEVVFCRIPDFLDRRVLQVEVNRDAFMIILPN